jgi:hypothetical protein
MEKHDPHRFRPACDFAAFPHWSIVELRRHGILSEQELARRFVFCVVRNPWDRLVSLHHLTMQSPRLGLADRPFGNSFSALVEHIAGGNAPPIGYYSFDGWSLARPQTDWLDGIEVDYVGRFESLAKTWSDICHHLEINVNLPHANASRHRDYRTYYTDETAALVADAYRKDIECFGYSFDTKVNRP